MNSGSDMQRGLEIVRGMWRASRTTQGDVRYQVWKLEAAIRGPDLEMSKANVLKEKYTVVIRRVVGCDGVAGSGPTLGELRALRSEAQREEVEEARGNVHLGRYHFLNHVRLALDVIVGALEESSKRSSDSVSGTKVATLDNEEHDNENNDKGRKESECDGCGGGVSSI